MGAQARIKDHKDEFRPDEGTLVGGSSAQVAIQLFCWQLQSPAYFLLWYVKPYQSPRMQSCFYLRALWHLVSNLIDLRASVQ